MRKTHILALACLMLVTGTAKAVKRSQPFRDVSGRIETVVIDCEDPRGPGQNVWAPCYLPDDMANDFVVVGGGGEVLNAPGAGAMLTASYPNDALNTWQVRSKDHIVASSHSLKAYLIAIRLVGLTRQDLLADRSPELPYIYLKKVRSQVSSSPAVAAPVDPGYWVAGGGARVNWTGVGQLLVASRPGGGLNVNKEWYAKAKDHSAVSPAAVDAFVIGIRKSIPGWGTITPSPIRPGCSATSTGVNERLVTFVGGATTSIGGEATYTGQGRMLTMLRPFDQTFGGPLARVQSKDHLVADAGCVTAEVMQLSASF